MNKNRMHCVIEYIKTQPEFPFDVLDVEDGVETVLAYFGLHPELDDEERGELKREFIEMAARSEMGEIAATVTLLEGHYLGMVDDIVDPVLLNEEGHMGEAGYSDEVVAGMPAAH